MHTPSINSKFSAHVQIKAPSVFVQISLAPSQVLASDSHSFMSWQGLWLSENLSFQKSLAYAQNFHLTSSKAISTVTLIRALCVCTDGIHPTVCCCALVNISTRTTRIAIRACTLIRAVVVRAVFCDVIAVIDWCRTLVYICAEITFVPICTITFEASRSVDTNLEFGFELVPIVSEIIEG